MQVADRPLEYKLRLGTGLTDFAQKHLGRRRGGRSGIGVVLHVAVPDRSIQLPLDAFRILGNALNLGGKEKKARKVIKGSRWLLLRNPENTRDEDRVRLQELLKANRKLTTAYLLKEDLKHLWDYSYEGAAKRFWRQWYSRAIRSRIEPLKKFARRLKGYLSGILSHCRWPLNTSVLEGINNKIKVIKRRACGFRDDDYFFLKIRQAFPGIHRST